MSIIENKNQYKKRIVDKMVERYLKIFGAICIEGPKWCGKTWTSAFHSNSEYLVGDPKNNFSNRRMAEIDPAMVLEGETPRLIDEWQEVPSIWDAARGVVDKRGKKGQLILTGSSTPPTKGVMHSGTGRIGKLRINTMTLFETNESLGYISLSEFCQKGIFSTKLIEPLSLKQICYMIVRGGWPSNIDMSYDDANILPKSYIDNLINDDLEKLDKTMYNKHKMELLMRSLARNESTTASELSLYKDILENDNESISRNTISIYLDVLKRLFLIDNQPPFSPNIRSSLRVKQQEKRHYSDPSLACALLNIKPMALMEDLNTLGFLFESLVIHDLKVYADSFDAKLYHYQDYNNNEIDAVVELDNGEWCAFEIKLSEVRAEEGAKNLIKVSNTIKNNGGKPPKLMAVICGISGSSYKREDGVYVIPFNALKD